MSFRNLTYIFIAAILLQSCSEDFFSKTIELDNEWDGPQMVIEARLNASHDTLAIFLHRSKAVFGTSNDRISHIANADVTLRGEDGSAYEFSFDTLRNYNRNYFAIANPRLSAGVRYTLEVEHPDFEQVKVEATMPEAPILTDFDWDKNYRLQVLDSIPFTLLELNYQDNGINYFSHIFEYGQTEMNDTSAGGLYFQSDRFEVGNFQLGDEHFNAISSTSGNELSFLYEIPTQALEEVKNRPGAHMIIFSQAISDDDYLFHKSVEGHSNVEDIPFVEPVIVYSNIENANGIFSLINSKKYTISFPE